MTKDCEVVGDGDNWGIARGVIYVTKKSNEKRITFTSVSHLESAAYTCISAVRSAMIVFGLWKKIKRLHSSTWEYFQCALASLGSLRLEKLARIKVLWKALALNENRSEKPCFQFLKRFHPRTENPPIFLDPVHIWLSNGFADWKRFV